MYGQYFPTVSRYWYREEEEMDPRSVWPLILEPWRNKSGNTQITLEIKLGYKGLENMENIKSGRS